MARNRHQDQPTPTTEPPTTEPTAGDLFGMIYGAAIENRHPDTGTLPLTAVDAVATAYRKLRGGERSALSNKLTADFMAKAMSDPSAPNVSMMVAVGALSSAMAAAGAGPAPKAAAPVVSAQDAFRDALVANMAAEYMLRETAPDGVDVDAASTAASAFMSDAFHGTDLPDAILSRAVNVVSMLTAAKKSRGASTGTPRAPRVGGHSANMKTHILQAVEQGASTLGEIKAAHTAECPDGAASGGAIANRYDANDVPGVRADRNADGRKVFVLA